MLLSLLYKKTLREILEAEFLGGRQISTIFLKFLLDSRDILRLKIYKCVKF